MYPAALNIELITLSSLICLKISITKNNITEKPICTKNLIFFLFELLSIFKKSIQNEVVNEVKAESALEYAAAIIPNKKIIDVNPPKLFKANIGYKSSDLCGIGIFNDSE